MIIEFKIFGNFPKVQISGEKKEKKEKKEGSQLNYEDISRKSVDIYKRIVHGRQTISASQNTEAFFDQEFVDIDTL